MAKKLKRDIATTVQLKVRLPEWLRRQLERAAKKNGWSMNLEIVDRLDRSIVQEKTEAPSELARAVIRAYPDVARTIFEILRDDFQDELMAMAARKEERQVAARLLHNTPISDEWKRRLANVDNLLGDAVTAEEMAKRILSIVDIVQGAGTTKEKLQAAIEGTQNKDGEQK
jgi:hypothetical protein